MVNLPNPLNLQSRTGRDRKRLLTPSRASADVNSIEVRLVATTETRAPNGGIRGGW